MKRWMTVTVLVPESWAEGVSNFLLEQGQTGIEETGADPGFAGLRSYFPDDGKAEKSLAALRRYLTSLERIDPGRGPFRLETAPLEEQDWGENWKQYFKPVRLGTFVVKPPWERIRRRPGEKVIEIHPGMAFGTGTHASTQLCLRAMERVIRRNGLSVLDVGTGSGILAIAASLLGATRVVGVDNDPVAIENALENAALNGLTDALTLRTATAGQVRGTFDVVVANIDIGTLRKVRGVLVRRVATPGYLVLSGILARDAEEVRRAYRETGAFASSRLDRGDEWVSITFKKRSE
jgi:ribosomal protein L11 methyltransferase